MSSPHMTRMFGLLVFGAVAICLLPTDACWRVYSRHFLHCTAWFNVRLHVAVAAPLLGEPFGSSSCSSIGDVKSGMIESRRDGFSIHCRRQLQALHTRRRFVFAEFEGHRLHLA